ncbi:MAG TPA: glycerate kinase [Nitrospirales bacterium]|nr:glycerate kinase [Nitrospirales bacterium]
MTIDIRPVRVRALLARVIRAALVAADPARAMHRAVSVRGRTLAVNGDGYSLPPTGRLLVVGAGKASARMAHALEYITRGLAPQGLIVVKYAHVAPTRSVEIVEAGHPIPDRAGVEAAGRTMRLVRSLSHDDLLIVLLSGGASALWPAPARGLTLADKQRTTDALLRCGATIQEINTVRKHLSAIKGGRLAAATRARVVSLILSDVLGDDLAAIGSGPTAPDPTTYRDAVAILRRYGIWSTVPERVRRVLIEGRQGRRAESPKPGERVFLRVTHHIVGNLSLAMAAAAEEATRAGRHAMIVGRPFTGEAKDAAHTFVTIARALRHRHPRTPICLVAGGETTVRVSGRGLGGRAQEFALAAALELQEADRVTIAACGTDGTDGPTDAAGAVVDGGTVKRAARIDAEAFLARHDSYDFFRRAGGHIKTGPTGTNVNDLYLALLD